MKTEFEIPDDALSDELKALFAETTPLTTAEEKELGDSIRSLRATPSFQADVLKAIVVDHMLEGMEREGLNKKRLAERWGKSRQYVGRILDEDARVNFTLETVCEMLSLVGKRLRLVVEDVGTASAVSVRSSALPVSKVRKGALKEHDTRNMDFWRNPPKTHFTRPLIPTQTLAPHDGEQDKATANG